MQEVYCVFYRDYLTCLIKQFLRKKPLKVFFQVQLDSSINKKCSCFSSLDLFSLLGDDVYPGFQPLGGKWSLDRSFFDLDGQILLYGYDFSLNSIKLSLTLFQTQAWGQFLQGLLQHVVTYLPSALDLRSEEFNQRADGSVLIDLLLFLKLLKGFNKEVNDVLLVLIGLGSLYITELPAAWLLVRDHWV